MEPTKTQNAAIEAVMHRMMRNLFTMLPVEILEYDAAFQTCTVRPMMKFPYVNGVGDIRYVEPPPIQLVPVAIPGSAASRGTIKLAEGDFGLYIVSMFSINEITQTDPDMAEPKDPNTHGLMDGFVVPIDWFLDAKTGAALTADRHISGADVRIGNNPGAAFTLARASSVQSAIDSLVMQINAELALKQDNAGTPGAVVSPTISETSNLRAN